MSRRKHLASRRPSGQIKHARSELLSPGETRRLLDAASNGLRDPAWGTMIGRLYLMGKIAASEFASAKNWIGLVAAYSVACQSPRQPRTATLEGGAGSMPADPDSALGVKEARRHERAVRDYLDGRNALRLAGPTAERVVDSVCIHDYAPVGVVELEALQNGLQALSSATIRKGAR